MLFFPGTQTALPELVTTQGSLPRKSNHQMYFFMARTYRSPKDSPGQTLWQAGSSLSAQLLLSPGSSTEREGHLLLWDKPPLGFLTPKRGWSTLEDPFQNYCISRLSFSSGLST